MAMAFGFGSRMLLGALACFVHGLSMDVSQPGSDTVRSLHQRMVTTARRNRRHRRSRIGIALLFFFLPLAVPPRRSGEGDGACHDRRRAGQARHHHPDGNGPFPVLIFHHGSTGRGNNPASFAIPYEPKALAEWFKARGWAVVLPRTVAAAAPKASMTKASTSTGTGLLLCRTLAIPGADRASRDIDAITTAIMTQPFVDQSRFVVGGQSRSAAGPHRHQIIAAPALWEATMEAYLTERGCRRNGRRSRRRAGLATSSSRPTFSGTVNDLEGAMETPLRSASRVVTPAKR